MVRSEMSGQGAFQFCAKASCHFWMGKSNSYLRFHLIVIVSSLAPRYLGGFPINRVGSLLPVNRLPFLHLVLLFSSRLKPDVQLVPS